MQTHTLPTTLEPVEARHASPVNAGTESKAITSRGDGELAAFSVSVELTSNGDASPVKLGARRFVPNPIVTPGHGATQYGGDGLAAKAVLLAELRQWANDPSAVVYVVAGLQKKLLVFPDD